MCILFALSGKSIHLAGKVYTFPYDKKRIIFLCGKLGKVDKFLVFHIRILYYRMYDIVKSSSIEKTNMVT